jgi:DNA-binding CsgD family transcriptional regulator
LAKGRDHGLREGFTIPIRMADEPDALFSVARASDDEISGEDALAARLIGTIAFDRGRAIHGEERLSYEPVPLSPRQIDCIALVGQGKSDWEAAKILGLSRDTVHEYVEGARRRYGVRRRTQLVLRAVRDGHLNIDAML